MPLVTFLPHEKFCPEGLTVEVEAGTNILELAHDHHIEMESACGGVKACTTCHCIVRKGFDSLEEADELEEDMLDKAWGLEAQSRLGCQVVVGDEDLTIEIPKYSLNHAAEAPH
ncbi:ISC system 2Fe-2S type ferredoxin [Pseudomonas sp. NPDC012596]|uniref:ISC system 2Fe-2S type ferredoxin n=1 Tax=Pseudomonas sp. NPDC012596 TaxID=3364419 RepID=UPI0029E876A6|nr:ISC system 2Fe-2S type ferredoxin [Pseudomonas putida]HYQ52376.1 ISC system 2Fe-2S type ferredoxin [Pseudomonas sp.]